MMFLAWQRLVACLRSGWRHPLFIALCCAGATVETVTAQERAGEAGDTATAVQLEPVVVEVLRTPLPLLRAPFAVSVVERDAASRARPALALDEALRGVPGVQVDNRFNYALGERVSIRGFGARTQFGIRGVKIFLDGLPVTLPDGQTTLNQLNVANISRAEVLRGPASALYGGNALGGVIRLESAAPPAASLVQEVVVAGGSDGLLRLESSTGGSSGPASYVLELSRQDYDGYRSFSEATNYRANLRLRADSRWGRFGIVGHAVDYTAQNPGSLSDSLLRADRSQAFANNVRQQTGEEGRQAQIGVTWSRGFAAGEAEAAVYALTRSIDNPIPPRVIDLDRAAGGARAIFRSKPLPRWGLRLAGGAEIDTQRDDRNNFANNQGERGTLLLAQRERVTGSGVFAEATAEPVPRLTLLAALRYDRLRFEADDELITAANPDDSGSRTFPAWSPSAGFSYRVAEGHAVYGNISRAFETPTTTEFANRPDGAGGFNPELNPQRATSYEAGTRGRIGALASYEFALYHADVSDALIPFEVAGAPGRQFFRNAGSATHRGVEAGVELNPGAALTIRGSYSYTDARFDSYVLDGERLDDNRLPGAVPHRAQLGATWRAGAGYIAGDFDAASRTPVNDRNTAHSPGHVLVGLRGGLESRRVAGTSLAPFVGITNLLDARYNASVVVNAFGSRFYEPGPGRSFFAGVRVAFGAP